jgi:putative redox protein
MIYSPAMAEENPTNVWKEITTTWDGVDGYLAENKAGGTLLTGKGQDGIPRMGAMEMLLVGLAACTAIDIIDILKKKQQLPQDFKIKVRGNQRLDVYPKVYTEFEVQYFLWGENLQAKDVEQAIRLSEEKYCSVGGTLSKAGPIRSTYRILKPDETIE